MKKWFSVLLVAMILFIPVTAFAQEAEVTDTLVVPEATAADTPVALEAAMEEPSATEALPAPAIESAVSATNAETLIEDFVERLYVLVLNRPSDPTGKAHWVRELSARRMSGGQAAYGFFFSEEMASRNLSDSAFLDITYRTLLGREPDPDGKYNWQNALNHGHSRKFIFSGFVGSPEFADCCYRAGISPGNMQPLENRDTNLNVTGFVSRLYENFLGRTYDVDGLNNWCGYLNSGRTAAEVATGFFYSTEASTLSNEQRVEACYRAFLGRTYDPSGKNNWMNQIAMPHGKERVFYGFVMSQEFTNICAQYGIPRGNAPVPPTAPTPAPGPAPNTGRTAASYDFSGLSAAVDSLVARMNAATRSSYRSLKAEAESLERQIETLEDAAERDYRQGLLSLADYRIVERTAEGLEDRLDNAEDWMERRLGYDD
ncbi:MAG TPA: hypothetical protein DEB31_00755 [Clostridiales bacterium]|nr:hypothetical protein [Clostridiales bacterium]